MDDPSRFTSINEYYTFIYAISYMILVELGIWIYNFKGWLKRPDKKNNDYGTILIVMLGCWGSFYFSTYFSVQIDDGGKFISTTTNPCFGNMHRGRDFITEAK